MIQILEGWAKDCSISRSDVKIPTITQNIHVHVPAEHPKNKNIMPWVSQNSLGLDKSVIYVGLKP